MFDQIPLMLAQVKDTDAVKNDAPTKDKVETSETDTTNGKEGGTTTQPGGTQPVPPAGQPVSPFDGSFLYILVGMFVLMIFFSMRTQKKERKKREALLGAIKKGDRIQTIGGILGNVVEVREHKVVVKIDENNNTKMTFARTAIQTIFEDKSETEDAELSKPN